MASDVQLAAGPFSPSPLRFDVSDVARLRKRVGRASASLKFIALLLAIAILFGLDTYVGTTLALVTGVLVGWGLFYAANRLRSGSTGAAIVAATLWLLWARFHGLEGFPQTSSNLINGFCDVVLLLLSAT